MTLFSFSHLCLKFKFVVDVNNIGGSCRESVSSELQREERWHKIWARIGRNFFLFRQNEPGDLSDHSTGGFWLYTDEGRYEYLVGVQRSRLSLQTAIPSSHSTLSVEILLSTHPIQYGILCPGAMVIGWLRVSAPSLLVVASKVDRSDVVGYICCHCGEFTTWKSQLWERLWFAQCHLSLMFRITGKPLLSLKVHHLVNISA